MISELVFGLVMIAFLVCFMILSLVLYFVLLRKEEQKKGRSNAYVEEDPGTVRVCYVCGARLNKDEVRCRVCGAKTKK